MLEGVGGLEVHVQSTSFQKSMFLIFLNIDLHASKHIDFRITYQPKPYQKISIFWLIRILSEIDFGRGGLNQV